MNTRMMFARGVAGMAKMIVALFLLAAIVVGLVVAMEFPGMRKYERLCDYPNKDALLAAEPDEVKKVSVLTIVQILATMTVFYGDGTVPGRLEVCKTKGV